MFSSCNCLRTSCPLIGPSLDSVELSSTIRIHSDVGTKLILGSRTRVSTSIHLRCCTASDHDIGRWGDPVGDFSPELQRFNTTLPLVSDIERRGNTVEKCSTRYAAVTSASPLSALLMTSEEGRRD